MKTAVAFVMTSAAAFLFMGFQTGLFGPARTDLDDAEAVAVRKANEEKPAARSQFPQDLAPAARAQAVPTAAAFEVADKPHRIVFLKPNGAPHAWHAKAIDYGEEWAGTSVENTELVVVVSPDVRTVVEHCTFVNGPPIDREKWELEASVVEAKTGKVLASRRFINMPREIQNREAYETTSLGRPVRFVTVFEWVQRQSRLGFPQPNAKPLVTVVDR